MKTFATLFSGGGGADLGLMAAGLRPVWAVEYDAKIAGVYADNFDHAPLVADVRGVDFAALPLVDWLHASPVCTRASVANSGAVESPEDIETAQAVVRAVVASVPRVVTIENVWGYRKFEAFRVIVRGLERLGYVWTVDHVNAADYGVPQTRRRLILRAVRGALLPPLPAPVAWIGWYAAIEDLIADLPDSELPPWQAARLPSVASSVLFGNHPPTVFGARERTRAEEPAFSVSPQYLGRARAVLLDGNNARADSGAPIAVAGESPAFTITGARPAVHRALLLSKTNDKFGDGTRADCLRGQTIGANEHGSRVAILGESPRVVKLTPRALARLQSFPDSYRLPATKTLAAKIIGNAVPPLLMERIAGGLLAAL